jgi:sugar O-acyltransferase (sialic acid O-acetyltransferase NeuD family)
MHPAKLPPCTNESILIFGAGGHGRVVADAVLLEKNWIHVFASDRNPAVSRGELLPGIPLLDAQAVRGRNAFIHIAIGNNIARLHEASLWGYERLVTVIHPSAVISHFSTVAAGCYVAAGAVVGPGVNIGMGVIINHGAVVDHGAQVGAFSHIAPNATLGGDVRVGQRVLIGSGAVILPSIVIADNVTVGAGAAVTTHLVEPGVYAGVPARKIK